MRANWETTNPAPWDAQPDPHAGTAAPNPFVFSKHNLTRVLSPPSPVSQFQNPVFYYFLLGCCLAAAAFQYSNVPCSFNNVATIESLHGRGRLFDDASARGPPRGTTAPCQRGYGAPTRRNAARCSARSGGSSACGAGRARPPARPSASARRARSTAYTSSRTFCRLRKSSCSATSSRRTTAGRCTTGAMSAGGTSSRRCCSGSTLASRR